MSQTAQPTRPHRRAACAPALLLLQLLVVSAYAGSTEAQSPTTRTSALLQASPEPERDPLTLAMPRQTGRERRRKHRLVVVSAGRKQRTRRAQRLRAGVNRVCPADYPRGLSVQCKIWPLPADGRVFFRVDGETVRVERRRPYFVAGDSPTRVFPFSVRGRRVTVACRVRGRGVVKATIVWGC